jgi:hypothetical protein
MSVISIDAEQTKSISRQWKGDTRFLSHALDLSEPRRHSNNAEIGNAYRFPPRPDASALNAAIPLFYIGQNRKGAWVVREAEGRSGGLFLFKQWAVRFARRQSEPAGCAIMFLAEPLELDIDNRVGCIADSIYPINNVERRTLLFTNIVESVISVWRKISAFVSRNLVAERRNRAAIERELFAGRYMLSSKNDDDLPVVR